MIIPAMFSTSGGPGLSTIRINTGPYIIKFLECIYIQNGPATISSVIPLSKQSIEKKTKSSFHHKNPEKKRNTMSATEKDSPTSYEYLSKSCLVRERRTNQT